VPILPVGPKDLILLMFLDPTSPNHIICCDTPDNPVDLAAAGSYAYICDRYGGLRIINLRTDY